MKNRSKRILPMVVAFMLAVSVFGFSNGKAMAASKITNNRVGGKDRYETSQLIAERGWKTSDYAIIATGEDFADALCSAPLAKKYNAPIILTNKSSLSSNAKEELQKLKVKTAIIIGGPGAVSNDTEDQILALNINTKRIWGINRFDTSAKVAKEIGIKDEVIIATGEDFPDAMSVASIAAIKQIPILLTRVDVLSKEIKPYLKNTFKNVYVIGGTGVVSNDVCKGLQSYTRIGGANRYDTNVKVLDYFKETLKLSTVYLATGQDFPDALSASALAQLTSSPILFIYSNVEDSTKNYIVNNYNSILNLDPVGGTGVIPDSIIGDADSCFGKNSIVTFKDKNVENEVRNIIQKPSGDLYKSDVTKVTDLKLNKKQITDLNGIENLTGLVSLDLTSNQISDISNLKELTHLQTLILDSNQINDISSLKALVNLKELNLSNNKISNIDALKGLTNLNELRLNNNSISESDKNVLIKSLPNCKIVF